MARLEFDRLSAAWKGEATDFTPLLNEQLDVLGDAIGVDLASVGQSEVETSGGRRIDIVAQGDDGTEVVIENQYGRADHDHLTRGLAYAVARHARGLVVVAEEHRDEFRAVAQYLNEVAERDLERGIAVWLVEAKAARIGDSPWAPLFTAVVKPNSFTSSVERAKSTEGRFASDEEFLQQFTDEDLQTAAQQVLSRWADAGHHRRFNRDNVVLMAAGPSANGLRSVVAIYTDGRVLVPFGAFQGQNSGIPIEPLCSPEFRADANALFGLSGSGSQPRTAAGWLTTARAPALLKFCLDVADAYAKAQTADEVPLT